MDIELISRWAAVAVGPRQAVLVAGWFFRYLDHVDEFALAEILEATLYCSLVERGRLLELCRRDAVAGPDESLIDSRRPSGKIFEAIPGRSGECDRHH